MSRQSPEDRMSRLDALPGLVSTHTAKQLADRFGITPQQIRWDCKVLGISPLRTPRGQSGEGTDDMVAKNLEHRAMGRRKRRCVQCDARVELERFRGLVLCRRCLMMAGDHDPDYERAKREAALSGQTCSMLADAPSVCDSGPRISKEERERIRSSSASETTFREGNRAAFVVAEPRPKPEPWRPGGVR